MTLRPSPRLAWGAAAAIAVAAALVALVSIVRGDFSETDGRIVGTLALVLYNRGSGVRGADGRRARPTAWLGARRRGGALLSPRPPRDLGDVRGVGRQ